MDSQTDPHKFYAGIGSRETPLDVQSVMGDLASRLERSDWILRTGGAPGADMAFWFGVEEWGHAEVFLPWKGFNGWDYPNDLGKVTLWEPQEEAYEIAEKFHPRWQYLKFGAKKLHARNVHQVLGFDVTAPDISSFVICWTAGAKGGGGTGQAIRIANSYDVPVYDLADPGVFGLLSSLV